jgi:hypothetical protein
MLEDRLSPETAALTVVLENHSDIPMVYGEDFSLETYRDGAWTLVEFQEHYGFAAMGWMLYEYDQEQISYPVSGLQEPLTQGLYRITTSEFQEQGMNMRECHPGLSLEFLVQEDGAVLEMPQEPEYYIPEPLPEIEDWQWYTWGDCVGSYEYEGYSVVQYVSGSEGFLGLLYQEATSSYPDYEEPMYLDLFDRKTGIRYSVYTEPVVEFGHVTALEGGSFLVEMDQEALKFWVEDGELRQEQASEETLAAAQTARIAAYELTGGVYENENFLIALKENQVPEGTEQVTVLFDNQSEQYAAYQTGYSLFRVDGDDLELLYASDPETQTEVLITANSQAEISVPTGDLTQGIYRITIEPIRIANSEAELQTDYREDSDLCFEFAVLS